MIHRRQFSLWLPAVLGFVGVVALGRPAVAQTPPPAAGVCPAQLGSRLNQLSGRVAGVRWSIAIRPTGSTGSALLYSQNANTPLIPASNVKLLTTAASLQQLGAAYKIRTSVTAPALAASLPTLRIVGRGDPSLTPRQLGQLTTQLAQRGIRETALLIGDDTFFRGALVNPNWDAEDTVYGYAAPVNSLILNQNAIGLILIPQQVGQPLRVQWEDPTDAIDWRLSNRSRTVASNQSEFVDVYRDRSQRLVYVDGQLRVGSASEPAYAAIDNPGNYLVQKLRNLLAASQIRVAQSTLVRSTPAPPGEVELAFVESPPLSELIRETNQASNNVYAEALLKTLGRTQTPATVDATTSGTAAIRQVLTPLGVASGQYALVDGSGLSDRNRASATAFLQTLQAMARGNNAPVFRASLPVAGVSGTLKDRFRGTPAQNRVWAKTGTIGGVVALSGYITPPSYDPLSFSVLANFSGASTTAVRNTVDEMVITLARLRRC
jgi:serine-type D-Ala-D-Ala carboxypeptidase/endopeptidase (penicillin-binding protein 4)